MKSTKFVTILALGSVLGLMIGCGQKEQPVPQPPVAVTAPVPQIVVPPAPTVAPVAVAAPDQVQSLIDKIKGQIAEKKYVEAMSTLKELSAMNLTTEQQTIVDELKAQIEKAMQAQATSEATKSLGGVLGK